MKLAIADPPYLGVARLWYGHDGPDTPASGGKSTLRGQPKKPDAHLGAAEWDDPVTHRHLVQRLMADYDGWAVAMKVSSLWHYLQWVPQDKCHVAAWVKKDSLPTGTRPRRLWEPVLIRVPEGRRKYDSRPWQADMDIRDAWVGGGSRFNRDNAKFAGAKPPQWTRWVLTMLGYDADTDTVDDLFGGSGAVTAEIRQGVLL